MNVRRLRSRIERLERQTQGGECQGYNLAAQSLLLARGADQERPGSVESSAAVSCPECGNPNPKMSIRFIGGLVQAAEEDLKSTYGITTEFDLQKKLQELRHKEEEQGKYDRLFGRSEDE